MNMVPIHGRTPPGFFATFKKDLQVLIFKMELYWHSPVFEEKSTGWLHIDIDILLQLAEESKFYFKENNAQKLRPTGTKENNYSLY